MHDNWRAREDDACRVRTTPLRRSAPEIRLGSQPASAGNNTAVDMTMSLHPSSRPERAPSTECPVIGSPNILVVISALLLSLRVAEAQGTFQSLTITFDGLPLQPTGTQYGVTQYYEAGMSFTPIDPNAPWASFVRNGGGISGFPENGTAYLQADLVSSLKFSSINGFLFELDSVDLAEYSIGFQQPVAVQFVGYKPDGSAVTTGFVTDGIIDGTGPLADFQTFSFGPEFSGLSRVEIPSVLWSLDNLVVSYGVPEPGMGILLTVGSGLLGLRLLRRKARP